MKNKIILTLIILITLCLSVSAVAADENATDVPTDEVVDEPIVKSNSTLSASNVVGYDSFSTKYTVKLESNGSPLANRQVNISINDVTYEKSTNARNRNITSRKYA